MNGACLGRWSLQAVQVLHPVLVQGTCVISQHIAYGENLRQNKCLSFFREVHIGFTNKFVRGEEERWAGWKARVGQVKKAQLVTAPTWKATVICGMRQQQLKEDTFAIAKSKVRLRPGSETEPEMSLVSRTEPGIMSPRATPLKSRCCGERYAEG